MRNFKIASIVIVLFFTFSCSENNKINNKKYDQKLIETSVEVAIKINENINPISTCLRYFENDKKEILAYMNGKENEICFFDINNKILLKTIHFDKKGPNGVGKVIGFDIVNFDTIFISSKTHYTSLFIVDTTAKVKLKIDFSDVMEKDAFFMTSMLETRFFTNVSYDNGEVLLGNFFGGSVSEIKKFNNFSVGYSYNIKQNKKNQLKLTFPSFSYRNNKVTGSMYTSIFKKNKIILSFCSLDEIFISNNLNTFKKVDCRSRYITKKFKTYEIPDLEKSVRSVVENPRYLSLVYDEYRNIYYRFAYPGIKLNSDSDFMALNSFKKVFSVMILDENLVTIGETLMPEDRFNPNMYFINKDGLYISENHIRNPKFDPDYLKFKLFELTKYE